MGLFGRRRNRVTREAQEVKRMELALMQARNEMENFRAMAFKYQQEFNRLAKKVTSFCHSIIDLQYAKSQIGGGNLIEDMDVYALIDFSIQQLNENRTEERKILLELSEQISSKEQEIEGLKSQLSRYLLKEKGLDEGVQFTEEALDEQQDRGREDASPSQQTEKKAPALQQKPSITPEAKERGVVQIAVLDDDDELIPPPEKKEDGKENSGSNPDKKPAQQKTDGAGEGRSKQARANQRESTNAAIEQLKKTVGKKQEKESDVVTHMVNLADYMEKMSDLMWGILQAIGGNGVSESKEVKKLVLQGDVTESAFNTALSQLRKMNIVDQEKISTGWRWFYAYELTDIGQRIFLEKFKQNPIDCEKQILKKQHSTALHGYCIKDAAHILRAVHGYDEATIDRKSNSIKLYNDEVYIPDVIAKRKSPVMVDYFEVELGHHTQADFNKKCDKMRAVTKDLYFIVPDATTKDRILAKQIGQWVLDRGGRDALKGLTIYLTTMTKLYDGKWDSIYRFD